MLMFPYYCSDDPHCLCHVGFTLVPVEVQNVQMLPQNSARSIGAPPCAECKEISMYCLSDGLSDGRG